MIDAAVEHLRAGALVAYPTDTLYGLAADPRQPEAVTRLLAAKRRAPDSAIPLIGFDADQLGTYAARFTPLARRLAKRFWPGPLTLVLDAETSLDRSLLAGNTTVAVRVPDHAVARALAERLEHPITATSANPAGVAPPQSAAEVVDRVGDHVALVLDGGLSRTSEPSTILDVRSRTPRLIRAGVIPWDRVVQSLT